MLIKFRKEKKELSQEQIDSLDERIGKYQAIDALLKSEGWRILSRDLDAIVAHMSDIRNKSSRSEDSRIGFCDGVSYVLARIKGYKRSAEKAEQTLREFGNVG